MSEQLRVGIGFDAHALAAGGPLVLAGVEIPAGRGLVGHSDADLVVPRRHRRPAGRGRRGDIGALFPVP